MSKLREFFTVQKLAFIWTVMYFVVLYFLFWFMFRFDMMSPAHWFKLTRVHLHGLPGLAFGTLILATVPVYVAMLSFIIKNKKSPVPLPFCAEKKSESSTDETTDTTDLPENDIAIPKNMPTEMIEPYLRTMRGNANNNTKAYKLDISENKNDLIAPKMIQTESPVIEKEPIATLHAGPQKPSSFAHAAENMMSKESADIQPKDMGESGSDSNFPLPTDFDFDAPVEKSAPVFKSLSFGPAEKSEDAVTESPTEPGSIGYKNTKSVLKDKGFDISTDGDIIIATAKDKKFAIAVHDDSDFWIADESSQNDDEPIDWFATGKQKPSPAHAARAAAAKHNAKPVLYLAKDNIMDLENIREKWESGGVLVVTDPNDIK